MLSIVPHVKTKANPRPTRLFGKKSWYIAHELLCFEPLRKPRNKHTKLTVWENLILTQARGPEEAYKRALERGRENEAPIKIDGEDGRCLFIGLRDLTYVYDPLEDGAELEWRVLQVDAAALKQLVKAKRKLQAFKSSRKRRSNDPGG